MKTQGFILTKYLLPNPYSIIFGSVLVVYIKPISHIKICLN